MRKLLLPALACFFFFSCARIPVQSVSLMEAVETEGARMHSINMALLHSMFREKKEMISTFIENEYTPALVENFKKQLPASADYKTDFAEMVQSLIPHINARKDSLLRALDEEQFKIMEQMQTDYAVYQEAVGELKRLLTSAAKIDAEKKALFDTARQITNNRVNLAEIEAALDSFIISGGSVGSNVQKLSQTVNSFLKK
ncbi:MAG: hypothetical protein ACO1NX_10025 [Chitinophagaceae bacterium]